MKAFRTPYELFATSKQLVQMGWIQNAEARMADDTPCAPEDERAVKWCTVGAWKAVLKYEPEEYKLWYLKYMAGLWNSANIGAMVNVAHGPGYYGVETNNDIHATQQTIVDQFNNVLLFIERHPEVNNPTPQVYQRDERTIAKQLSVN